VAADGAQTQLRVDWLMSLTVLVTLGVLGCDFLIYLLHQWALGERGRALLRKSAARQRSARLENLQPRPEIATARSVRVMSAKRRLCPDSRRFPSRYSEEFAYRRRGFLRAIEAPRLTAGSQQDGVADSGLLLCFAPSLLPRFFFELLK
jgi:hypothetical protein